MTGSKDLQVFRKFAGLDRRESIGELVTAIRIWSSSEEIDASYLSSFPSTLLFGLN